MQTEQNQKLIEEFWEEIVAPLGFPRRNVPLGEWLQGFPVEVVYAALVATVRAVTRYGKEFQGTKHFCNTAAKTMRDMVTHYRMFEEAKQDIAAYFEGES